MFCKECGGQIKEGDNFCKDCGKKIDTTSGGASPKADSNVAPTPAEILWKKFLVVDGDEAKKYRDYPSDAVWEIIRRFVTNGLADLSSKYKQDFDNQPYKAIEAIKSQLQYFVIAAHQLWLTERLLENENYSKIEIQNAEDLAEEWKRVHLNYTNDIVVIPPDANKCLNLLNNMLGDKIFEQNPTLQELPKIVVDAIKQKLVQQLIYGYFLGVAEGNLKK